MEYLTNDTELTLVADAIRNLGGTTASISYPFGWVDALNSIETWPYGECGDLQGSVASRKTLNATFQANASITFVSFPSVSSVTSSRAFRGCGALRGAEFRILTSIPRLMFATCSQLQSVSFPECTTIDYGAFLYCIDLKKADFPNVTTIMDTSSTIGLAVSSTSYFPVSYPSTSYAGAFERAGIVTANFSVCTTVGGLAFRHCSALTTVNFPACVTVRSYAFAYCSALTTVNFPACTTIVSSAFADCSALTTVSFPVCSYIGGSAFVNCSALTTVNFPVCESIEFRAFGDCSALTTVNFPVCESVGSYAFSNCSALTTVSFPVCTEINSSAFCSCKALISVSFPICVNIKSNAFQSCSSLSCAYFPAVSIIHNNAFKECNALTSLYLVGPVVARMFASNAFQNTPMSKSSYTGAYGSIYVPASLLTSYKTATNWTYYSDRIVGLTDEEIAAL